MTLYCDNYASCNSLIMDQGGIERMQLVARTKGWHLYEGETLLGKHAKVVLCRRCVDGRRRDLPPAPPHLQGQLELELEYEKGPGTSSVAGCDTDRDV